MSTTTLRALGALLLVPALATAQRATLSATVKQYVAVDTPVVALTHVRVIDGTGAAPKEDQTLIIRDGNIALLGAARSTRVPEGAQVMDLTGKSVIPGLVMMHEHLYYPTGPGVYGADYVSFSRLYLAGGVTSMRTGGNVGGYADLNLAAAIKAGTQVGPWIDATAPYVNGPSPFTQMYALKDSADARRFVAFWADAGATSFKAYMNITRAELAAAVDEAHRRGLKITGHLCSVTYREAADLGIDDLEHGFFVATDFVKDKQPDVCPAPTGGMPALVGFDAKSPEFTSLVQHLISHHVAVTSTLTVFETVTPGQPATSGTDVLDPLLKTQYDQLYTRVQQNTASPFAKLLPLDPAAGGDGPDGRRWRDPRLLRPTRGRAARRERPDAARGDQGLHPERGDVPRPGGSHRFHCGGQAGRPRGDRRQSRGHHCRYRARHAGFQTGSGV